MKNNYNLILMSFWRTVFDWFVDYLKSKQVIKIAYIMNAAKHNVIDNPDFIFNDKVELEKFGFEVDAIDLDLEKNLKDKLDKVDLIYVRGGNTFDLLNSVRNSGFERILPQLLEKGKIYAGSSAGSILLAPSIEIAENDFMPDENNVGLTDKRGLGLVDFAIFPHYLDEYEEKMEKLLLEMKVNYPVIRLRDNQVVLLENGKENIINT